MFFPTPAPAAKPQLREGKQTRDTATPARYHVECSPDSPPDRAGGLAGHTEMAGLEEVTEGCEAVAWSY